MDKTEFYLAVLNTIRNIKYKPSWFILLGKDEVSNRLYLQVEATTLDASSEIPGAEGCEPFHNEVRWRGGKRYLSPFMCRQEIVGICFDLFKSAEEHEMREWFKYRDVSIYCPHIDPDWLADNVTDEALNYRQNATTMEEI